MGGSTPLTMSHWAVWLKGVLAAAIAGSANGVITGFAAASAQDPMDDSPGVSANSASESMSKLASVL